MCEELEEELAEGKRLAGLLAEHLDRSGAAKIQIPLETDNGCYYITIAKTL